MLTDGSRPGVLCQIRWNILHYLASHACCDLSVVGALAKLLPIGYKGEDRLSVHEEELSPVNLFLVLQHKLVSVVTILVAAHLAYYQCVWTFDHQLSEINKTTLFKSIHSQSLPV